MSLRRKNSTFAEFVGVFGNEPIDHFDSASLSNFKGHLLGQGLSVNRVNKKLSNMREVFLFAISNGHFVGQNPVRDMKIAKKHQLKAQTKSYEPFNTVELQRIFNPVHYKAFNKKPEYFFCPLIAFYTGARLEEIASLKPSQVVKDPDSGIFYLDVLKAKNIPSVRKIPVPQRLIETGFLQYVENVREKEQIFPNLFLTANGYGRNVGRRFADYLDTKPVDIVSKQKVFHSFRHTFINKMTEKNINSVLLMALVGHFDQADIDLGSVHAKTYQHNKKLEVLKTTIDMFDIEIPQLKYYSL